VQPMGFTSLLWLPLAAVLAVLPLPFLPAPASAADPVRLALPPDLRDVADAECAPLAGLADGAEEERKLPPPSSTPWMLAEARRLYRRK